MPNFVVVILNCIHENIISFVLASDKRLVIRMLCEQAKIGEDVVRPDYLRFIIFILS